jgi:hypothetical protein
VFLGGIRIVEVREKRNEVQTLERNFGQRIVQADLDGAETKNIFSDKVENRANEVGQGLDDERESLSLLGDETSNIHLGKLSIT